MSAFSQDISTHNMFASRGKPFFPETGIHTAKIYIKVFSFVGIVAYIYI